MAVAYVSRALTDGGKRGLVGFSVAKVDARKAGGAMFFAEVGPIPREDVLASVGWTGKWSSRKTQEFRKPPAMDCRQGSILRSNCAAPRQ